MISKYFENKIIVYEMIKKYMQKLIKQFVTNSKNFKN